MMDFLHDVQALRGQAQAELIKAISPEALEAWRIKYLGRTGQVKAIMDRLRDVAREEKPQAGRAANDLKHVLQGAFDSAVGRNGAPDWDIALVWLAFYRVAISRYIVRGLSTDDVAWVMRKSLARILAVHRIQPNTNPFLVLASLAVYDLCKRRLARAKKTIAVPGAKQ